MQESKDKHILIVEDGENDAILFSDIIENMLNLSATIVHNGRQAVKEAASKQYDLVLLDQNLPDLNGNLVALELRRMENYKSIPIIAITAYDHADVRRSSLSSGCNIFLTKPINIDILMEVIQIYLQRMSSLK